MKKLAGFFKTRNGKILLLVAVVVLAFGWYEVWPTWVKSRCSWTFQTIQSVPAFAGRTADEAERINIENEKNNPSECLGDRTGIYGLYLQSKFNCQPTDLQAEPPRPAVPARKVKHSASKAAYENCLRHYGL